MVIEAQNDTPIFSVESVAVPEVILIMPPQEIVVVVEAPPAEEIKEAPKDDSIDFEDLSIGDSERNVRQKEEISLYSKLDHNLHIDSGRKRQANNRLHCDKGMAAF